MRRALLLVLLIATVAPLGAQAVKRPGITGIAFARFYTTDPPGAQKFYGNTLGYKRLESNGVWIYPVNSSQWIEILTSPPPPKPDVRMAAVAFTTRNAAGLVAKSPPSPDATSKRVIHVGFIVRDAAKEDAFWRDVLGFRPYWHGGKTNSRTDYQSIQVPDGTDWLEYMLNVSPTPTLKQTGVMDHFSLGVAHMADAVAALQRNKCDGPNCTKTQVGRDGKVQLNLYDPDFTRVEFMEFTPTKEPCCSPFVGKHPGPEENR
jgi:catechol 2,3-dioxygenase-like lactoylglutathione lyase family enzyme